MANFLCTCSGLMCPLSPKDFKEVLVYPPPPKIPVPYGKEMDEMCYGTEHVE